LPSLELHSLSVGGGIGRVPGAHNLELAVANEDLECAIDIKYKRITVRIRYCYRGRAGEIDEEWATAIVSEYELGIRIL